MASSSDGVPAVLPAMPDFSAHSFSSAGDMKFHLQNLLDSKEKQLQQAGTLGQRVLAQQMELEERIRQLQEMEADKSEDDDIDAEATERYRELSETIRTWDAENAQLSSAFGSKRFVNGKQPSPSLPLTDLPRDEPERSKAAAGSSAAQSRRAKNAAHRADDVEFAFEIGSGLLTEVRRLQSLLGERDKAIQDMKEEKDDLEKTVESLRTALRSQEQSSDKYKEENWNLEVTLQELRTQLSDSQASTLRLEGEHKRLTKLLSSSREATDTHKTESEKLKNSLDELKAKHETDIAQARKHAAGLQRDKSDLQSSLDTMKAEAARASRRLPRFGSPLTPDGRGGDDFLTPADGADDDVFSTAGGASTNRRKHDNSALFPVDEFGAYPDSSPDPSPSRPFLASNHPSNEIEALQQRLAHAQRQINTLKGTLQREKELRMEYRRKWESSPGGGEDDEGAFEDEQPPAEKSKPRLTPFRSTVKPRGRGRGRGGLTLVQRLGMAANSPSSEYNDDSEPVDPDTPPPPVPPIPIRFHEADEKADIDEAELEEEQEQDVQSSPSPLEVPSNRTSVDGMDPAFANVLKRSPSAGSSPYNGSPLRQSVVARAARGGATRRSRGGAAYQEPRPPSLVGQPEALAAELGLGITSIAEIGTQDLPVETAEFGCQTDFDDETILPPSPPPVVRIIPAMSDMAVQVDPEPIPVPEPEPTIVTNEMSCQTDPEPVVLRSEMGMQHDAPVEPAPVLVSTSMNTDPEELPIMVQAEVQTPPARGLDVDTQTPKSPLKAEMDTQTSEDSDVHYDTGRRTTITQYDLSRDSIGSSSGDTTITRGTGRAFLAEHLDLERDDGEETETGPETETDMEDYHDARQSLATPSSQSINDFHSVLTMTDNDFSETDDDGESIKASRMPSRQSGFSNASAGRRRVSSRVTRPLYESKAISADVEEEEPAPKPEVKEMSIQTDEWVPPAPVSAPAPIASPPAGFGLYRVGSTGQQFQFVSPPSSAGPTTTSMPTGVTSSPSIVRDSNTTFTIRPRTPRTSQSDKRQSIESVVSSVMEDAPSRSRVSSAAPSTVDKSRPPMMVLPPPPRQPPPPASMPPPSFIPERRIATTSTGSYEVPPPRPSSPPPAELIQRATTPTFGSVLSIPGRGMSGPRQHGSSMPPSQQGLRQPPSTSSFRSAANAAAYAGGTLSSFSVRERERREMSSTSLVSDRSMASPRSSMSSDHHVFANISNRSQGLPPATPNRMADLSNRTVGAGGSTDPAIIHAITQTMIGEFLYKYTRRTIGKGHGDRRHKRFFWVHPYTKTLYWSSADPGSSNVSESSAKSAYIEEVRSVLDPNPMPPGLYQYSVVVSTPQREMKITAPTKERHDIWLNALKYLLSRPNGMPVSSPANGAAAPVPLSPMSGHTELLDEHDPITSSPQSQRSGRSARNEASWSTTPRGQRSRSQLSVGGSIGKRSGTPAAEYLRWNGPESPYSPTKSFEHIPGQGEDLDFELHGDNMSEEEFEGLENVRACCDGRHTVGHHHHHARDHVHNGDHHLDVNPAETARPVSPAWSFRSRTGSTNSHEGGTGIFSWGRGEDGKLRFGSRRSTKTVPGVASGQ